MNTTLKDRAKDSMEVAGDKGKSVIDFLMSAMAFCSSSRLALVTRTASP